MGKLNFKNIDENIKKLSSLDSFSENQSKALENYKTAKANLLTALGAVFVFGAMTFKGKHISCGNFGGFWCDNDDFKPFFTGKVQ